MRQIYTAMFYLLCVSSVSARGQCEGILGCLIGFFNGDVIGNATTDEVISIFEIEPNLRKNAETQEEESIYPNFDLIKETKLMLDTVKKVVFDFEHNIEISHKNDNIFTNLTYKISTSETYIEKVIKDNRKIANDITNSTRNKSTNTVYPQTNTTIKAMNNNESLPNGQNSSDYFCVDCILKKDSFDGSDEIVTNKTAISNDYLSFDYISEYEDTTNEIPYLITSINIPVEHNIFKNGNSHHIDDLINSVDTEDKNYKNTSENKTRISNDSAYMWITDNEVLDEVVNNKNEDTFLDYPEIQDPDFGSAANYTITTEAEQDFTTESGDPGFQFLGEAAEAQHLCMARRALSAERLIGLPYDRENYWNGTFHAQTFKGLTRVDILIEFTTKSIVVENDNAKVSRVNATTFAIHGVNASRAVEFRVQSLPGEGFPFLKKIKLNGREICKERRNWSPSLIGVQAQAVLNPFVSPHKEGPYYCGRSQVNFVPLVVKGQPTREGDYPWHVALFIKNDRTKNWDYSCGGTILAGKTIITAAHCVVDNRGATVSTQRLLVVAGKYKLFQVDPNQVPIKIGKVIVHLNYTNTRKLLKNDLALLITEQHIEYGQYVQPVCSWNHNQTAKEVIYQEYGTVVGWGVTENDSLSDSLMAAAMRVAPDSVCLRSRPSFYERYLSENTFCSGNSNGSSACNGDSGGGLVFPIRELDGRTSWYLRGVVSVGVRREMALCDPRHYVVFTDVPKYKRWIEDNWQL